jgi:LAGLIDADG endonuclease
MDQERIEQIKQRLTLPYIAGFFDGEGSITVTRDLSLQVVLGQNDETILQAIAQYFGMGKVKAIKIRRGHKQCFALRWCGANAAKVLEQLKDFLILKKERAEIAIKMQSLVSPRGVEKPVNPEKWEKRKKLAVEIKALNDSHWSRRPAKELIQ